MYCACNRGGMTVQSYYGNFICKITDGHSSACFAMLYNS